MPLLVIFVQKHRGASFSAKIPGVFCRSLSTPPCTPSTRSQPPAIAKKRSARTEAVAWHRPIGRQFFWQGNRGHVGVEPKRVVVFPPKWMVKIMENPIKIHDLGGFPPLFLVQHPCGKQQKKEKTQGVGFLRCLNYQHFPPFFWGGLEIQDSHLRCFGQGCCASI